MREPGKPAFSFCTDILKRLSRSAEAEPELMENRGGPRPVPCERRMQQIHAAVKGHGRDTCVTGQTLAVTTFSRDL